MNRDGTFEIMDRSLKINFIELEFPFIMYAQFVLINVPGTNLIKKIEAKNIKDNKWSIVWEKDEIDNFFAFSDTSFKTNQIRFYLENDDFSSFLNPFSIGNLLVKKKKNYNVL